jgi:hypothetical protein
VPVCPAAAALSKESKMSNGAIYIVTQDARYIDLVCVSAERLKTVMPDLWLAGRSG